MQTIQIHWEMWGGGVQWQIFTFVGMCVGRFFFTNSPLHVVCRVMNDDDDDDDYRVTHFYCHA